MNTRHLNGEKALDILLWFTISVYSFVIIYIILLKSFISSPLELFSADRPMLRGINLIPFKDLWITNALFRNNMMNILGNVFIFIPIGIYLVIFLGKKDIINKITIITGISLFFELFQYIFSTGITDINDIILNVIGGILGIMIYKILSFILQEQQIKKLIIILGGVIAVLMFLLIICIYIANRT